ncbi:hypothetical protein FQA39_LY08739 [Lamprigera yunnana]|nr:hypothetical protein FQA39_LY08739 [Lamprigera yunnana]
MFKGSNLLNSQEYLTSKWKVTGLQLRVVEMDPASRKRDESLFSDSEIYFENGASDIMILNKANTNEPYNNNIILDEVTFMDYLGSTISDDGKIDLDLIRKTIITYYPLNKSIFVKKDK